MRPLHQISLLILSLLPYPMHHKKQNFASKGFTAQFCKSAAIV